MTHFWSKLHHGRVYTGNKRAAEHLEIFAVTCDCVSTMFKWIYNVIITNCHAHLHTQSHIAQACRMQHWPDVHTSMHYPHTWLYTHESVDRHTQTNTHESSAKPHIHTVALARHKPHSYTHAHSCSAYLPAIGPDPDTACQCTSLPEPQAAGAEEETDGYQLFGWEPCVHSYCIASTPPPPTHTHTHTCMKTNSFKLFNCVHVYTASRIQSWINYSSAAFKFIIEIHK